MQQKYFIPLFLFTLFLFISCGSNDNPLTDNNNELAIRGRLIDENGEGIEGVNIHYIPQVNYSANPGSAFNKTTPSTKIEFSIPSPAKVFVFVLRYNTQDTVAVIINGEELNAGVYSVGFNEEKLTNGVYTYIINFGSATIKKNMLLLKSPDQLVSSDPLTRTDNNGNFVLTYKNLALGLAFPQTAIDSSIIIGSQIISNQLSLFMTKEGYQNKLIPLTIDTTSSINKTIKLKR